MAVILFFGRFSDLSDRLDIELPETVTDKDSLTAFLSEKIEGFAELNADEIAYMSALSGG